MIINTKLSLGDTCYKVEQEWFSEPDKPCPACNGQGNITVNKNGQTYFFTCDTCRGNKNLNRSYCVYSINPTPLILRVIDTHSDIYGYNHISYVGYTKRHEHSGNEKLFFSDYQSALSFAQGANEAVTLARKNSSTPEYVFE